MVFGFRCEAYSIGLLKRCLEHKFPDDPKLKEDWIQHLTAEMSSTLHPSLNFKRLMTKLQRPQLKLVRPDSLSLGEGN
ncbi:hypothetical protein GNI_202280 [Gregarina niphandrodes]|uniref:Uncharacterized protein n=1 Tax=Gregarina niphandrodes TaxID=110365 RepID=A0A023AW83_GRENI|nr:hypothetical protein GNI_202280 [Gregarina niphandrodes]EZG42974.1 hypothetical protein GNI_202280 [Gregarina niphandrodes]|eukprot:XP_011133753.1 hypothetical protein GNI_202280 [Gregarina niphandrodes]